MAFLHTLARGSMILLMTGSIAFAEPLESVELEPSDTHPPLRVVEPLETDRPDFTETTTAVPKGSLQVETGAFWEKDEGVRTWHIPEALFRVGIGQSTELRLVAPEYLRLRGRESANNFGDIEAGLKQELGSLPGKIDLALMPMVTIPTGANKVSTNSLDGSITLLWSRDIGDKTEIGGNLELELARENQEMVAGFIPTVVVARNFNKKWGGLIEYRGAFTEKGKAANFLHYAITYKIRPLHQLDIRFGHALSGDGPSLLVGAGYSFRIDELF